MAGGLDIGLNGAQQGAFHLKDTGVGISSEDLSRVFDPFFSTKPQGTGMGLTAVYHIVANHLGEVEIASAPAPAP